MTRAVHVVASAYVYGTRRLCTRTRYVRYALSAAYQYAQRPATLTPKALRSQASTQWSQRGLRNFMMFQHQADPVHGVMLWDKFMSSVEVITSVPSEPRLLRLLMAQV